jgi:hypothetical protein
VNLVCVATERSLLTTSTLLQQVKSKHLLQKRATTTYRTAVVALAVTPAGIVKTTSLFELMMNLARCHPPPPPAAATCVRACDIISPG